LLGLLCATPLLLAALSRIREKEAWDLVESAAGAHRRVSYAGTAAWGKNRRCGAVRVENDAFSGLTRYGSTGSRKRWSWVSERPSSWTPDPAAFCLDLVALEENYRAREKGTATRLGRPARVVELLPRHAGRPRLELTLDAETLLPLKVDTYRADGTFYRSASYLELSFGPRRVKREFKARKSWRGAAVPVAGLSQVAGFEVWLPAYLPEGFRCIDSRVREWLSPEAVLLYSDGATVFELRQHIAQTPARMEAALARRMGPNRVRRVMSWILARKRAALIESDGGGRAVVRRRTHGTHCTCELNVDDREITATSRTDLDAGELIKVLRSLHAR